MASAPSGPTGRAISHGARADPPPYSSAGGGSTSTTELLVIDSVRCRSVTWKYELMLPYASRLVELSAASGSITNSCDRQRCRAESRGVRKPRP